jgi:hypothetical protein
MTKKKKKKREEREIGGFHGLHVPKLFLDARPAE